MPSWPGFRLVSISIQAGQVIGGSQLLSMPEIPAEIRAWILGRPAPYWSKTSPTAAQSKPMIKTLEVACIEEREEESDNPL